MVSYVALRIAVHMEKTLTGQERSIGIRAVGRRSIPHGPAISQQAWKTSSVARRDMLRAWSEDAAPGLV